jgi:hypothetical protein
MVSLKIVLNYIENVGIEINDIAVHFLNLDPWIGFVDQDPILVSVDDLLMHLLSDFIHFLDFSLLLQFSLKLMVF